MCTRKLPDLIRLFSLSGLIILLVGIEGYGQHDIPPDFGGCGSRRMWVVGPSVTLLKNYHSGRSLRSNTSCSLGATGGHPGYGFGLSAEYRPTAVGDWSIVPRVAYERRPGEGRGMLGEEPYTASIICDLLGFEVCYKYEVLLLGDLRLGAFAGPAFQYVLQGEVESDLEETAPSCFENFFSDINPTRFSAKAGVQGEIGLFDNEWALIAGLSFDYGMTPLFSRISDWRVHSLSFQIDVRRAL